MGQKVSSLFVVVSLASGIILGYLAYPITHLQNPIVNLVSPPVSPVTTAPASGCGITGEIFGDNSRESATRSCCPGLKKISLKQLAVNNTLNRVSMGGGWICSPCGNGKCDSQYEDRYNCPGDCK